MALILRNGGSQSPGRWLRDPRNNQNRREKLGITQKQMAENLSLTQSMIAQVERGTKIPNMILGLAIARMLGCTMEDLVEDAKDE